MAMYMEPGGTAAKNSSRVSMEDVAEEVLNGFFCHYEPPTSTEYQHHVAEQIRKNPNWVPHRRFRHHHGKSILRPSRQDREAERNSKSVTWRDERNAPTIEVLERKAPNCMTGCDIMNSSTMEDPSKAPPTPARHIPPTPKMGVASDYQRQNRMDENDNRKSPRGGMPKKAKGPILYDDEGYPYVDEDSDDDGIVDENMPPFEVSPPSLTEKFPSPQSMPAFPHLMNPFSCGLAEACWPSMDVPTQGMIPKSDGYTTQSVTSHEEGRAPSSQSIPYRRIRSPPVRNRYVHSGMEEDEDEDADSYEARAPNRIGRAPSRTPMAPYSYTTGRRSPSPSRRNGEYETQHSELNRLPVPRRSPNPKSLFKRWRRPPTPNRRSEYDTDEEEEIAAIQASASKPTKLQKEEDDYDSDGFVDHLGRAMRPKRRSLSRDRGGEEPKRSRSPARVKPDLIEEDRRGRSRSPSRRVEDSDYVLETEEEQKGRRRPSRSPIRRRSVSADSYRDDDYESGEDSGSDYYDDDQGRSRRMSREYDDRRSASFDYNSRRSPRDRDYDEYDEGRRSPRRPSNEYDSRQTPRNSEFLVNSSDFDGGAPSHVSARGKATRGEKEGRGRGKGSTRAPPMTLDQGPRGSHVEEDDYFPESGVAKRGPAKERVPRADRSRRVSDPTPASYRPKRLDDDKQDYEDYDRRRPHSTTSHTSGRSGLALDTNYDEDAKDNKGRPDPTPRKVERRDDIVHEKPKSRSQQPLPPTPRRAEKETRRSNRRVDDVEDDDSTASRARRMLEKQLSPVSQATDSEIREEVSSVGMESSTLRPQYANPFLAQNPPNPFLRVPPILEEENQTTDDSDPSTLSSQQQPIAAPKDGQGAVKKTESRSKRSSKKQASQKQTALQPVPAASAGSIGSSKKSFLGSLRKKMGIVKSIVKEIDEKRLPGPDVFKTNPHTAPSKD